MGRICASPWPSGKQNRKSFSDVQNFRLTALQSQLNVEKSRITEIGIDVKYKEAVNRRVTGGAKSVRLPNGKWQVQTLFEVIGEGWTSRSAWADAHDYVTGGKK